ncbi:MAG: acetylornithine/N-succinyldiaminopimelate aminotransferase [Chloroflexota bacterium]|nr:acetylornithine/N-succinyldiaminopimelate aminotransferase [Chloroflexota bacterium]
MSPTPPDFEVLRDDERRLMMSTFKRLPVQLVRGDRWLVYDEAGREYLDFVAGIAVNVLGHAHPAVVAAIREQAGTLVHTSNLYYTSPQVELARALLGLGFEGRAFFANSGAEVNEAAVKLARKWGKLNRDGAFEVISTENSFHGRTLAMVAATGQKKFKDPVEPMPDGFVNVPFNDLDALRAAVSERTVAILLEPIQGEGGIIPATDAYLQGARELCDEENLLLILDEIQTGMGRTGTFFAFEAYGVLPDVVTLAKGLGGGVPIGACLANARADVFAPGDHGGTFGGNPLACAAALATLRAIREEGVVENAASVGAHLEERLRGVADDFDCVTEVRGRGLMQAIVFDRDIAPVLQAEALLNGLIVNASSERVLRFIPPLTIGRPEVDRAIEILERCLDLVLSEVAP